MANTGRSSSLTSSTRASLLVLHGLSSSAGTISQLLPNSNLTQTTTLTSTGVRSTGTQSLGTSIGRFKKVGRPNSRRKTHGMDRLGTTLSAASTFKISSTWSVVSTEPTPTRPWSGSSLTAAGMPGLEKKDKRPLTTGLPTTMARRRLGPIPISRGGRTSRTVARLASEARRWALAPTEKQPKSAEAQDNPLDSHQLCAGDSDTAVPKWTYIEPFRGFMLLS